MLNELTDLPLLPYRTYPIHPTMEMGGVCVAMYSKVSKPCVVKGFVPIHGSDRLVAKVRFKLSTYLDMYVCMDSDSAVLPDRRNERKKER